MDNLQDERFTDKFITKLLVFGPEVFYERVGGFPRELAMPGLRTHTDRLAGNPGMGTMKQNDLKTLLNILKGEDLKFAVLYGSSLSSPKDAYDIDAIAICKKRKYPEKMHQQISLGSFDLLKVDENTFEFYCSNLDPAYCTEPVVTGKLIYGDFKEYEAIKKSIMERRPNSDIVSYLVKKSCYEYLKIFEYLNSGQSFSALVSLSFSISYRLFAQWYHMDNKVAALQELVNKSDKSNYVDDVMKELKLAKRTPSSLNHNKLMHLIKNWEEIMLSDFD